MLGVKDLIDRYYEKFKQDTKCINDLLVRFMKDNHQDHFFIDELPVTVSPTNVVEGQEEFQGPDLTHLTGCIKLLFLNNNFCFL